MHPFPDNLLAAAARFALPLALLATLLTATAAAQSPARSSDARTSGIHGVVLDSDSRQPVATVLVTAVKSGRHALTDSSGIFSLDVQEDSALALRFERLGYEDGELALRTPVDTMLVVQLTPKPLVLEGLTVVADIMEHRRKEIPYQVKALSGAQLFETHVNDMYDVVSQRLLHLVRCPGDRAALLRCYRWETRTIQPVIFVDDAPLYYQGLEVLRNVPPEEIATIEVIPSIKQIRVYTKRFMELAATLPWLLSPVIIVR